MIIFIFQSLFLFKTKCCFFLKPCSFKIAIFCCHSNVFPFVILLFQVRCELYCIARIQRWSQLISFILGTAYVWCLRISEYIRAYIRADIHSWCYLVSFEVTQTVVNVIKCQIIQLNAFVTIQASFQISSFSFPHRSKVNQKERLPHAIVLISSQYSKNEVCNTMTVSINLQNFCDCSLRAFPAIISRPMYMILSMEDLIKDLHKTFCIR